MSHAKLALKKKELASLFKIIQLRSVFNNDLRWPTVSYNNDVVASSRIAIRSLPVGSVLQNLSQSLEVVVLIVQFYNMFLYYWKVTELTECK